MQSKHWGLGQKFFCTLSKLHCVWTKYFASLSTFAASINMLHSKCPNFKRLCLWFAFARWIIVSRLQLEVLFKILRTFLWWAAHLVAGFPVVCLRWLLVVLVRFAHHLWLHLLLCLLCLLLPWYCGHPWMDPCTSSQGGDRCRNCFPPPNNSMKCEADTEKARRMQHCQMRKFLMENVTEK